MALEAVEDLALHIILLELGPKDTVKVSCVSKRLRDSASGDLLWSKFCLDDLDLVSPQDPHGNPAPSFKVAYQLWREAFAMYPWPLVLRVKRCWGRIRSWLSNNFPEAKATLRGGASESDIEQLENLLERALDTDSLNLSRDSSPPSVFLLPDIRRMEEEETDEAEARQGDGVGVRGNGRSSRFPVPAKVLGILPLMSLSGPNSALMSFIYHPFKTL
ncbi:hypothetical protein SLEP1_g47013 [Rubroshorea leprosula]|uniref:F-box domain-containing protein n=1 Tax=Rubroshorea leprosula TaxID=152421 RepID=A0AAV5LR91_9ROSI|nr:hypothetical protein SLEP1_g47013 [Rubroshorea leprosula]